MKYPGSRRRRPGSSKLFVASLEQAVLAFLCENPERSFYSVEHRTMPGCRGAE